MKNRNILFLVVNFCTVTFLVANSRPPFDPVESDGSDSEVASQLEQQASPSMPGLTSIRQEEVPPPPPLLYFPYLDPQFQAQPLLSKDNFICLVKYKEELSEASRLPSSRKSAKRAKLETKNQEKFPCPVCKKYFLRRFSLDNHLDNCHWPYVGTYASRRRYPSHSSNPVRFQQQGTDKKE